MSRPSINHWQGRSVFVTGASGLLGSALVRRLIVYGADITALVQQETPKDSLFFTEGMSQKVKIAYGNLENRSLIEKTIDQAKPDCIFHLAAQAIVGIGINDPLGTFESNIRGSYHILEACRLRPTIVKRLVVASSDKAYGSSAVLPYTEDMPLQGRHPYDVSKSCMDLLSTCYHHTYGTPLCIVRCGNIYGPGDLNWSRIVPGTIRELSKGLRPIIRSDGQFTRDYLYVEDVVDGYLVIAENMHRSEVVGESFNIGPALPVTVLQIVSAITELMHMSGVSPDVRNQVSNEIRDQYLSSTKARTMLGWQASHSLHEGLKKTIPWYLQYLTNQT